MAKGSKGKRRNSEKRKEKSRDAARSRRGKESEVFSDLSTNLPVTPAVLATLDKASCMRVAISHLKLRKLLGKPPDPSERRSVLEPMLDVAHMQALNGVLMVIAREGDMVYLSENCAQHLGLSQIELIGQSIYDFTSEGDRSTIRETLEKSCTLDNMGLDVDFFMRLKCTLTSKGKNINLKSATYKVMHCRGHCYQVKDPEDKDDKGLACLILVAEPIPHPRNLEIFLDSKTLLTTHDMNMRVMFCDPKLCEMLGFQDQEMTDKCMYNLYHPADVQNLSQDFKLMKEMGQVRTCVYRLLAKNGGYVFVQTEATVIYNIRTEIPEHVVCVNYMISDVEEPGLILADFQMDNDLKLANIKEDSDVILATQSIFSLNTHDTPLEADELCYSPGPSAEDVMVALDYNDQDPKMVSMESLLHDGVDPASGDQLLLSPPSTQPASPVMPQMVVESVGSPPALIDISSDSDDTQYNMEHTCIVNPAEVDMSQRAPYISMSGDDDLIFAMESSVDEELSVGANIMLGKTHAIFNALEEEEEEEEDEEDENGNKRKRKNVPAYILRQLSTHSKKREYSQRSSRHNPTQPTLNAPNNTNLLETGPPSPPSKRARRFATTDSNDVMDGSVLFNLLLDREVQDDQGRVYKLPPPAPRIDSPLQLSPSSSLSSSPASSPSSSPVSEKNVLRDLLTCPLPSVSPSVSSSPVSLSPPQPANPPELQYITFDPHTMTVLQFPTSATM